MVGLLTPIYHSTAKCEYTMINSVKFDPTNRSNRLVFQNVVQNSAFAWLNYQDEDKYAQSLFIVGLCIIVPFLDITISF